MAEKKPQVPPKSVAPLVRFRYDKSGAYEAGKKLSEKEVDYLIERHKRALSNNEAIATKDKTLGILGRQANEMLAEEFAPIIEYRGKFPTGPK